MAACFLVGILIGAVIGIVIGMLVSPVPDSGIDPYVGKAPVPRRQQKPCSNEGTIFSSKVVKGGIH